MILLTLSAGTTSELLSTASSSCLTRSASLSYLNFLRDSEGLYYSILWSPGKGKGYCLWLFMKNLRSVSALMHWNYSSTWLVWANLEPSFFKCLIVFWIVPLRKKILSSSAYCILAKVGKYCCGIFLMTSFMTLTDLTYLACANSDFYFICMPWTFNLETFSDVIRPLSRYAIYSSISKAYLPSSSFKSKLAYRACWDSFRAVWYIFQKRSALEMLWNCYSVHTLV